MTDRKINKLLRKEFRPIGWILVGYYLLMNLMVTLVSCVDLVKQVLWNLILGAPALDLDMDVLMNNAWGYILCIFLGLILLHAWKGTDFWREEVFRKERKITPFVFLCAMCFCMGSQMLNSVWLTTLELIMNLFGSSLMETLESVTGSTDSFSMFLYGSILAPLWEEVLFRGYILRALRPYGRRFSIFGSALLFALFHGNLLQGPYAFLIGLVLGWLACEYSINWSIALHVFNNLVLAEGLGRITEYLPMAVSDGIYVALFGVSTVASFVILRRKRNEIRAYRQGEWIDRRCVKCLLTNSGSIVFLMMMTVSMIIWMTA